MTYIDGIAQVQERLAEAGVFSAQQLAFADPLRILVRTNFDFKVILDWVDQAFLVCYVRDKRPKLALLGIRGAIELAQVEAGASVLPKIAAALEVTDPEVKSLIGTIHGDATTEFLSEMWS